MKLVNAEYQLVIDFVENRLETLVLEHPHYYTDVISQLCMQFQGEAGEFILSDGEKTLNISKAAELIIDPFHIDLNNRRFLSKLYADLSETAEYLLIEKGDLNTIAVKLLDEVIGRTSYSGIVYDLDVSWEKIFQAYSVRVDDAFESLTEKMIEYIKIMVNVFGTRLFIVVGLRAYLTDDEISQVFETVKYLKAAMLLIESMETRIVPDEKVHIIDRDRCLIVKVNEGGR